MHELFDVSLKDAEQQLRIELHAPFLQSLLYSKQLLKVLLNVIVIVDAVQAKLDIRLSLLISLDKCFNANLLHVLYSSANRRYIRSFVGLKISHWYVLLLWLLLLLVIWLKVWTLIIVGRVLGCLHLIIVVIILKVALLILLILDVILLLKGCLYDFIVHKLFFSILYLFLIECTVEILFHQVVLLNRFK